MRLIGFDPVGNPIVLGCPYPDWCKFHPGPTHRHSIITQSDLWIVYLKLPVGDRLALHAHINKLVSVSG